MSEEIQTDTPLPADATPVEQAAIPEPAPAAEPAAPAAAPAAAATPQETVSTEAAPAARTERPPQGERPPKGERPPRGERPPKDRERQQQQGQNKGQGGAHPNNKGGNERRGQDARGGERPREGAGRNDRRPEQRRPEGPIEIEFDKLVSDSLYLDNQAHVIVARLRDLDAGTRSQLRRLYGAVRRACRAPEADRQHQFVMLRARLAYTIARHGLRSLDPLEKLLLQVTRRNETRGYDRFRDLFEAIIAYNE
ncbi:MAG TPA: type III-A CRISPR-associated protein Csm2 [Bryobacteraceae bacterium]|nr:type III-A CRISPR-associated protein Csm2 [Bryobacteraceae bacterium]